MPSEYEYEHKYRLLTSVVSARLPVCAELRPAWVELISQCCKDGLPTITSAYPSSILLAFLLDESEAFKNEKYESDSNAKSYNGIITIGRLVEEERSSSCCATCC